MADILVVDDDQLIVAAFQQFLADEQHATRIAGNAQDALRLIAERPPDLVIMDVRMPGMDGLQALQEIRARFPDLYVVIMTAYGTSQTSIDAIRAGAFDYVAKPLDLDDLRRVIGRAIDARHLPALGGAAEGSAAEDLVALVGQTPAMLAVYKMIARLATNDVPVLLRGEPGTGRRLVAETIHDNSRRRDEPFVVLDCATLTDSSVEGVFAEQSGTILFANTDAMPSALQSRLARALAGQERAAGGARPGFRVLASTTKDLAELVRQRAFNSELFEILSVITIHLPPLRERRSDIPRLLQHLVQRFNAELNRSIKGLDPRVTELLAEHPWPGNVRELQAVVKRACILARGDVITSDDIRQSLAVAQRQPPLEADAELRDAVARALDVRLRASEGASSSAFHDIVDAVEEMLVREALARTKGNQVKASDLLGVNRTTLRKKMP